MSAIADIWPGSSSHSETILVVDDNPANLGVISDYLKGFGFRILIARDGESALERAQRGRPDLILLDVVMPGIDGFETCRRLKADEALSNIPVIFMTSLADKEYKVKGFQAGGVDYIVKPFQYEEVLARVQAHLSIRWMHKQLEAQNVRLQQINIELGCEIAERQQATAEIQTLNAELEQRVRERTEQLEAANRELSESEARYRHLLHSVTNYVYTVEVQYGKAISTVHGPGCAMITGYTPAEYSADPYLWYRMIYEQERPIVQQAVERLLSGGETTRPLEHRICHKDGSLRWIRHTLVPHLDEQEQLTAYDGLIEDITARKLAEERLRESEDRFRRLAENAPDIISRYEFAPEKRCVYISPAIGSLSGFTPEEYYCNPHLYLEIVHSEDRALAESAAVGGIPFGTPVVLRWKRKDGKIIWIEQRSIPIYDDGNRLIAAESIARDITERRWAEKAQEAFYKISQAAISVDRLDALYGSIQCILGELMFAENFYIAIYDADSDMIRFPYYVDQYDEAPVSRKPGRSLTDYVLRNNSPLLATPEVFAALVERGEAEAYGAASLDWLGVPLHVENKLIGVMAVQSYAESVRYGEKELHLMEFVSTQVAMAIERKRSEEALRRKLDELTVLHAIALASVETTTEDALLDRVTQIIETAFHNDNFGVLLLDPVAGVLRSHSSYRELSRATAHRYVPLGENITGLVAASGRSRRIADVSQSPEYVASDDRIRSQLCVPLNVGERVIGVINAESTSLDAFSEADERLLETIAGQLATAVEKSRLFGETRQHLQRLDALHTIDLALTSSFDLHLTLNVLLEQVIAQLNVDAADVLLLNQYTQMFEYAAGRGPQAGALRHTSQRLGDSCAGRAALERTLIGHPNLAEAEFAADCFKRLIAEGFNAYYGVPLIAKGQVKGVLEVFHRTPLKAEREWFNFLEALAIQAAITIDNALLFDALQRTNQELTIAYDSTLEGWAHALELRDRETVGHTRRVTDFTLRLGALMGIGDAELVHVRRGALLHDIGKMGVPDSILLKKGTLNADEWEIMRMHPVYAYEMLDPIPYLRPALDIPYRHHEKWDGTGYPDGLKGEQIPLSARIFAVVDVWDALISDRPYRKAMPEDDVLAHIRSQAGTHFDPRVVDAFLELVKHQVL